MPFSKPSTYTANTSLSMEALVDIYMAFRPKLEMAVERRLSSKSLAHDLVQNIFLRIGSIKVDLCSQTDAERYFMRIAINASLDHIKIEKRRNAILDQSSHLFQHTYHSPEADMLAQDDLRLVEAALAELPPKCREVLFLSRMEGLTNAEIAAKLSVSRSLVEKYLSRSLLHCRQRLKQESEKN